MLKGLIGEMMVLGGGRRVLLVKGFGLRDLLAGLWGIAFAY